MKLHGKIQEKLKQQYEKKGYNVTIEATIPITNGNFYRVDLLITKDNKRICVEIGRTNENKINNLKKLGYEVRIVAFHSVTDGIYNCICGHSWKSRKPNPKACPNCKQYLYYEQRGEPGWT